MVCKKCNKNFSERIVIGNKIKSLRNRKYCLICSPYKEHNTRKIHITNIYDKKYNCNKCDKIFIYNRNKGCSKIKCPSCYVSEQRKKNKKILVEYKGGKCQICDYNKCIEALSFHHLNSNEKDFTISNKMSYSIKRLKLETDKCILVCHNCHTEIHNNITAIPKNNIVLNESIFERPIPKKKLKDICPVCNKEKLVINKTCSQTCFKKTRRKVDWDKIDLKNIMKDNQFNFSKTGRQLGVTDNAVRKRAKLLGII